MFPLDQLVSVSIQLKENGFSLCSIITTQLNRPLSAHIKAACTKPYHCFALFSNMHFNATVSLFMSLNLAHEKKSICKRVHIPSHSCSEEFGYIKCYYTNTNYICNDKTTYYSQVLSSY